MAVSRPLTDGNDGALSAGTALASADLTGRGRRSAFDRGSSKLERLARFEVAPSSSEPISKIGVGSPPSPRSCEIGEALESGVQMRFAGHERTSEPEDSLERVEKDATRERFSHCGDQIMLWKNAVLVFVHEHPGVGLPENTTTDMRVEYATSGFIHAGPFLRSLRLGSRQTRKGRETGRIAKSESCDGIDVRAAVGCTDFPQPIL
ncbi:MAG: hypothetical protein ACRDJ4_09810 [Actinomycetota bacterium]